MVRGILRRWVDMRDRKVDLCPRCGGMLRELEDNKRTVRGGVWTVLFCPRCLHVEDKFRRRRRNG